MAAISATVPQKMQAGMYFGHDDVRVVERPVPEIGPREVLASVEACGICGSDTMRWYREPQTRKLGTGINTGHEIAGRLVQVGAGITHLRAGQRVIITHHFPCLECGICKSGNETSCPAMHKKHIDPGGFAQFVRVLESGIRLGIYPMPDSMSYEEGSFVEPLGCVVRSVRKTAPFADQSVLVLGSGLAGLLHIRMARAFGASRICAVDMNQERLDAAAESGADELRFATETLPMADKIYVCTGAPSAASQALELVNPGGQVMFFAADGPDKTLEIPLTRYWTTQPSILFSYGAAPRDMQEALELIASGRVKVADLVTHRFPLEKIGEAFRLFDNPRDTSLKIIIEPNA
jgi:L-iditol 2-dehydrogenase